MSIEVAPTIACNLSCTYCYQDPLRQGGNFSVARGYDLDAMKAAVLKEGAGRSDGTGGKTKRGFALFGGEPLLMPIEDVEELWRWGFEQFGKNGIQTNGSLFTPAHYALVKRYRVGVGISMDGPDDLNDVRDAGSVEKTRAATARSLDAIRVLCEQGTPPSVICTLHAGNTGDKLPRLIAWFHQLAAGGVRHLNLHVLEVDDPRARTLALSDEVLLAAMRQIAGEPFGGLTVQPFADIRQMLLGMDERVTRDSAGTVTSRTGATSCIWGACDPYTTNAVRGVDAQGGRSNCGRTNKDGVSFVKSPLVGHERQIALHRTAQEHGGCHGCRFFLMCKGNCPGTAIDGDWRNRSEHCAVWFGLLEDDERRIAAQGSVPLSRSPFRRELERAVLEVWAHGRDVSLRRAVEWLGSPERRTTPLHKVK